MVIRKSKLSGGNVGKNLEVRCPNCEKKFSYYDGEFRPFCSERCKQIDLGNWAAGEYALKSLAPLEEEDLEIVISSLEQGEGCE